MAQPSGSAVRALALEYKSLQEEPVEGFRVKLVNEDNMFEWEVAIFGPPDTLYQGGYFKVSRRKKILMQIDKSTWLPFRFNLFKLQCYVFMFILIIFHLFSTSSERNFNLVLYFTAPRPIAFFCVQNYDNTEKKS